MYSSSGVPLKSEEAAILNPYSSRACCGTAADLVGGLRELREALTVLLSETELVDVEIEAAGLLQIPKQESRIEKSTICRST